MALAARIPSLPARARTPAWNGFNVLHTAAARVAGLDLGFVPGKGGMDVAGMIAARQLDFIYMLGADESISTRARQRFRRLPGNARRQGAERADVILPGAAYTEKSATFVNTEGRAQQTMKAVFPPGDAKEDWTIIRALPREAGATLPYDTLKELRAAMYRTSPQLAALDTIESAPAVRASRRLRSSAASSSSEPFASAVARLLHDESDRAFFRRHGRHERAEIRHRTTETQAAE